MSEHTHNLQDDLPADMQRELDLLVDGELDDAQRHALLTRLEELPRGWRGCALRFLEAQCLRQELRGMVREPASPVTSRTHPSRAAARPSHTSWRLVLSMAACLALAFGIGMLTRDMFNSDATRGRAELAQAKQEQAASPRTESAVPSPDTTELAMASENRVSDDWLLDAATDVPQGILSALERLGHRVERRHEFWPVGLEDGRLGVVPIERVEIRYVGDTYQ